MWQIDHLGGDASAVLIGVAHDEVRVPFAGDGEKVGHHCYGIDINLHARHRPRPCRIAGHVEDAGEAYGFRASAQIESRREGAEANSFHDWGEGCGAGDGDLMPRSHRRPRDRHERVEVSRHLERCEENVRGVNLPVVPTRASMQRGMLPEVNAPERMSDIMPVYHGEGNASSFIV
jgi:hypothetical protein